MLKRIILLLSLWGWVGSGVAGETGHYLYGSKGIRGASLPLSGSHWYSYNHLYNTNEFTDAKGDTLPGDFKLNQLTSNNQFLWISKKKIFQGDYGAAISVPLTLRHLTTMTGLEDEQVHMGDVLVEPFILGWHNNKFETMFSFGFYAPTGKYDIGKPALPGKNFWTTMVSAGSTLYFDDLKTWSGSVLGHYEMHSNKQELDIKPGNDLSLEWGIGKILQGGWEVGVAGYWHWQVTDDSGEDVYWDKDVHDQAFGMGPEINTFLPLGNIFISMKSLWEFDTKDHSSGHVISVTLTKLLN